MLQPLLVGWNVLISTVLAFVLKSRSTANRFFVIAATLKKQNKHENCEVTARNHKSVFMDIPSGRMRYTARNRSIHNEHPTTAATAINKDRNAIRSGDGCGWDWPRGTSVEEWNAEKKKSSFQSRTSHLLTRFLCSGSAAVCTTCMILLSFLFDTLPPNAMRLMTIHSYLFSGV